MNTDQMRNFAIAYRTHNFAAAARTIPMSAQGFTKSIRTLESELGVPLFIRDEETGAHIPTKYGDEFMLFVNIEQSHLQNLRKSFKSIAAEEGRRVILGASLGIMGLLGDDFVRSFMSENSGMGIDYMEMSDAQCEDMLASENFGLAFTLAPYSRAFETVELYSTRVCLWVNESNPLGEKNILSVSDLDGQMIALPGREFKCYESILTRCHQAGVRPHVALESSEMFWLYNFAYEGRGLAFSAEHLGDLPFFANGPVRCIPLEDVTWRFGISSLPRHRFTEAERKFRKFCIAYFRRRFGSD